MITALFLNTVVLVIGALFSMFPSITTLPTIGGFDIDAALVSTMGQLHTLMYTFWFIADVFAGFLFLMGYYAFKIGARFLLGHRAPGHY